MTYAVILAGGWGERLWPMSTRTRPKQLLSLTGESTLVSNTLLRIAPVVSLSDALVMTSVALKERMAAELASVPAHRIIGEPRPKNTAPAIALAAKLLAADDPDAVMVVLPADHVIRDDDNFRAAIELAVAAAETKRALVTLGIRPTRPETEYGYIKAGSASDLDGVFDVESFEEKPDRRRAEGFLEAGGYFWNSGIFIWRADVFLAEAAESSRGGRRALGRFVRAGRCRFRRRTGPLLRDGRGDLRRLRDHGEGRRRSRGPGRLRMGRCWGVAGGRQDMAGR